MSDISAGTTPSKGYAKYLFIPVLIVVVGYVLLYLTYKDVRQEIVEDLNARQMIHARQAARGIEAFFDDQIDILQNLARNEHLALLDETGKRMMREFQLSHSEEVSIITRIDSQGRILYPEPFDPTVIGQPVTKMEDFEEAKRTHKVVVSDVFANLRGFKSMIVQVPVLEKGYFEGALAVLLPFDFIAKRYVEDIRIGKGGYAWVISRNGTEVCCPVPGHVGNSVFDNCREFPDILAMAERMTRGEEGVTTYTFDRVRENIITKTTKHAVFMPIHLGNNFWSIVVATPEDEVIGGLQGFRNRLLLIAMLLIVGMGLFFYLMFRTRLVVQEMEQRKKKEEALRDSQERLNLALKSSKAGTWDRDIAVDKATWDEHVHALFGLLPGTFSGKLEDFLGLLHPDDQERVRGEMSAATDKEADYATTFRVIWPDSSVHFLASRGKVHRDGAGRAVRMTGINLDVTELKQAEESLRESERKFHSIFDSMGEIVVLHELICDAMGRPVDYRILDCNPAFTRSTGIPLERAIGALASRLYDTSEPPYLESYAQVALTGEPMQFETYFASMEKYFAISVVSPAPGRFATVSTDITERKRAEEERRTLAERLQRAQKMEALGTMAGGVAHDLNNVLGVVVGYSELLTDEVDESSSVSSYVKEIQKGGERAAAIVQDLLTLTRRGVPSRNVLNLNHIIVDCQQSPEFAKVFSYHPNIGIKIDFEADLLNISGSSVHLGKSFLNLVLNAAEAMINGGTLTIKTRNQYLDKPISGYDEVKEGDYVILSISDTGEGILAADLKRIFEPFYTKKVMGRSGTGLGLAVVWGTVKDHHGYLDVVSEEGKGTTFTLYFPVTREELSPEEVAVSASEYMGNGQSILVVDDVKEQRELATKMLTKLNYKVTSVSSGEEAVGYLRNNSVDLIVLDMIMESGMDGLDTYVNVLEIHPHQKAIIVSGFSETERVTKAQELGAGAYVKKPYVLKNLGLAVKEELDPRA